MTNRVSTAIAAATAVLGLLVASFLFGYGVGRDVGRQSAPGYELLSETEVYITESAVKTVERRALIQGAIRGMLQALEDPYASFLDPAAYRAADEFFAGQYSGVGLWMKQEDGRPKVVSVLADTPASTAGIQTGDVITEIDGKPVDKLLLDEVTQKVQGEPGTKVRLSITRGEQVLEFNLTREKIEIPSVESQLLRERVGVIEVIGFPTGTGGKVRTAIQSMIEEGAQAFILDLRGNPGGRPEEAIDVASAFLDGGAVVSFRERGKPEVTHAAVPPFETNLPLVVLVDEGSASASEIVAGAIQDRGRGIVVGTETYGKGSIQTFFQLTDGSAIKFTTASYFTPSGRSIGERGVVPDVSVAGADPQLARARQILKEMLAEPPARRAG